MPEEWDYDGSLRCGREEPLGSELASPKCKLGRSLPGALSHVQDGPTWDISPWSVDRPVRNLGFGLIKVSSKLLLGSLLCPFLPDGASEPTTVSYLGLSATPPLIEQP